MRSRLFQTTATAAACVFCFAACSSSQPSDATSPFDSDIADTVGASLDSGPSNSPPVIQISSPGPTSALEDDQPFNLVASVVDDHDAPSALVVTLVSSLDGPLGSPAVASSGQLMADVGPLTAGEHALVVAATDSAGLTAEATVTVQVNGAPSTPTVTIQPSAPTTASQLQAQLSGESSDPNRPSSQLIYLWTWFRDSMPAADSTGPLVLADQTQRGETWRVEVRASDGTRLSAPATAEVLIENSPPSCEHVTLLPSSGTTATEFACACDGRVDADGDSAADTCIFQDGTGVLLTVDDLTDGCLLPPDQTAKHMTLSCSWITGDGFMEAAAQSSPVVVVQNAAPTAPAVVLAPESATSTDLLECSVAAPATDLDDDGLTYLTSWNVNGFTNPGTTSVAVTAEQLVGADGAPAGKGDTIVCAVQADDGETVGPAGESNAIVLSNAAPTGGSAIVTLVAPKEGDVLECIASEATDPDGDPVTWTYQWLVNGQVLPGLGAATLGSEHFDKGDVVTCTATPSDGTDAGTTVTAKLEAMVANTPPTLAVATLSPLVVSRLDSLLCIGGGWWDPDPADALPTMRIDWLTSTPEAEPTVFAIDAGPELSAAPLVPGSLVWCRVTPTDGDSDGPPVESNTAAVFNYAPSLEAVSITPETPVTGSVLTCQPGGSSDAEDDPVDLAYRWLIGGTPVADATAAILAGSFVKGDEVRCAVTPHDPFDPGPEVLSSPVVIANQTPVITTVTLAPSFGPPCEPRTCAVGDIVDPDAQDIALVSHRWEVDGQPFEGVAAKLTAPSLVPGQEIQCFATVTDGAFAPDGSQVFSEEVASNVSLVTNNKPSMDSVSLGQVTAQPGDVLTCTPLGFSDPDCSTAPQWHYAWFVGALIAAGEDTASFDTTDLPVGTTLSCKATPFDGYEEGNGMLSAPVVLGNGPPTPPIVAVEPTPDAQALHCAVVVDASDPDGDELVWTWSWSVNGVPLIEAGGSVLAAGTSDCDLVACSATVSDDYASAVSNTAVLVLPVGPTCDDANVCTDEVCADGGGCLSLPNSAPCPDDDICNGEEVCLDGACAAGLPVECPDVTASCLLPACNPDTGACDTQAPDDTACPDGNVCNGDETCVSGVCEPGTPSQVSDGIDCTLDSCDPATGISHEPDDSACALPDVSCASTWCSSQTGCQTETLPNCCGNGVVDEGEICDDGNDDEADGCMAGCVECTGDTDPFAPGVCAEGVCGLSAPTCHEGEWVCEGPGYEPEEVSCDGFDNDCDGLVDEGVCPICTVPIEAVQANLHAVADIDFDYACRVYLTSLVSGPDFTKVIEPTGEVSQYFGNANQNMMFALADPDASHNRVVVTYSCATANNCQAQNGLTLLYTCDSGSAPACGCIGQLNCPGFLNVPFIATAQEETSVGYAGVQLATPTGLAVGPGETYLVGNLSPTSCTNASGCVSCFPDNPGVWCTTDGQACCQPSALGRLAQFTVPEAGTPPSWRIVQVFPDDEIIALASGADGGVMVGTAAGKVYRVDPVSGGAEHLQTFSGPVLSITQNRRDGHWYLEHYTPSTLRRLRPDGTLGSLPPGIPQQPSGQATLQVGPDGSLYRLSGHGNQPAVLEVFDLPIWADLGDPCGADVVCDAPGACVSGVCVSDGGP